MPMSAHYVEIKCRALTKLLLRSADLRPLTGYHVTLTSLCTGSDTSELRDVVGVALSRARDDVYRRVLSAVPRGHLRELTRVRREMQFSDRSFNQAQSEIIEQLRDKYNKVPRVSSFA